MRAVDTALATLALAATLSDVSAQSIEPRAYSNAPVGVNFLVAGYTHSSGSLALDPSLPLTNAQITTSNAFLGFVRALDVFGLSAKADAILPFTWLDGTADYRGEAVGRDVKGLGDPSVRLSVNLYGAPALGPKEFKNYHQDLIVGVSLQVTAPLGQYDGNRLINLGTHRWLFKPELGVSKARGPWTLELQASATVYTENQDFFHGNTRGQDPLYAGQTHVIYSFASGLWASGDATWYGGGRSYLNGVAVNDLQRNWRAGLTLAIPISVRNSIKLNASRGVAARTGTNFDTLGIAWQYRFGGGL